MLADTRENNYHGKQYSKTSFFFGGSFLLQLPKLQPTFFWWYILQCKRHLYYKYLHRLIYDLQF